MLRAARESAKGQVIAVMQPHRYTRLHDLFEQFCTCFNDADAVIVAPVYPAGEQPIPGADRDALVTGLRAHGHKQAIPLEAPEKLAPLIKRSGQARRLCGLPWCRLDHTMGIRAPGGIESAMSFPDIVPELKAKMPELRGRLLANQSLGEFTWFRVGGPAQVFFMPEDENDLAYFLRNLPPEIPVTVIGAGSNLIVRDGGVPGVVIRLGRGFNDVKIEDHRVTVGTAMLDVMVARAAQTAGVAGLAFLSGIPGTIGGALRMNGGAYGGETKDVLIEARGVDRQGNVRTFSNSEMGFSYRHCGVPDDVIFTSCGVAGSRRRCRTKSPPKWPTSRRSARRASRAIAPAAPPSKIRRAIAPGNWWTTPAAAGSPSVERRCPNSTAIS